MNIKYLFLFMRDITFCNYNYNFFITIAYNNKLTIN